VVGGSGRRRETAPKTQHDGERSRRTSTVGPALPLPRQAACLYSFLTFACSVALLLQSTRRGAVEFSLSLAVYLGMAVLSVRRPLLAPVCAGAAAFVLGFTKTHRHGFNLDLGASVIALSVAGYWLHRVRHRTGALSVDLAGAALLSIGVWSLVSLAFSLGRILAFEPAPGFGYHVYRFNAIGILSDEAIARTTIVATIVLSWFGLYEWARTDAPAPKTLNVVVFAILLTNSAAMVVQRWIDPGFLFPVGPVPPGRLNGVTSFCYALGSAVVALYLLLPAWGARRGPPALLTVGSLVLLVHAAMASGSRTSLVVVVAATLAWGALRAYRLNRVRRRRLAVLLLAAMALLLSVAGATYLLVPAGEGTSVGRLRSSIEKEGLIGHLFETRLTSYPLALRVMLEYPFSGVGVGLYGAEVSKQQAMLLPDLQGLDPYLLGSYAPNQFLNTGVELGIPALLALVVAFAAVAVTVLRRGRKALAFAIGLVLLAAALQLGPDLYNSEALVFCWLILGLAARRSPSSPAGQGSAPRAVGTVATTAALAGVTLVAITGHLVSMSSLSVEHQWDRLRWRMTAGMYEQEDGGGQWTGPAATFSVDAASPGILLRWHAGDRAATAYRARVSFYVDGALAEQSLALPGQVRETRLPLPPVTGFKRISVLVSPPFVPADALGGDDRRQLGIFIHSVRPAGQTPAPPVSPVDTLGLYDPSGGVFHLRTSRTTDVRHIEVRFGPPRSGGIPLAGSRP
jgi:hypothetical protein